LAAHLLLKSSFSLNSQRSAVLSMLGFAGVI
jgi:hypothetical protein